MKLYEFQGKELFRENGIPTPSGKVLIDPSKVAEVEFPTVLKAQVLTGGRGKAGAVRLVDEKKDAKVSVEEIFSMTLKNEPVKAVLAEEKIDIQREFYMSITLPSGNGTPILIFSPEGGMDIEKVAEETPEKISSINIDPFIGPKDFQIRRIGKVLAYKNFADLKKVVTLLCKMFRDIEATLIEINPLVETKEGLVALDSKIAIDDKSHVRQEGFLTSLFQQQVSITDYAKDNLTLHKEDTITHVPLSGEIALISDGAGTGMLAMDLLNDAGGSVGCFVDTGGVNTPETMYKAIDISLENPGVKGLIVVLIGGFNRMDDMAKGIVRYNREKSFNVPVVFRMCGTKSVEGKQIMDEAGLPTFVDLQDAVDSIVVKVG